MEAKIDQSPVMMPTAISHGPAVLVLTVIMGGVETHGISVVRYRCARREFCG